MTRRVPWYGVFQLWQRSAVVVLVSKTCLVGSKVFAFLRVLQAPN